MAIDINQALDALATAATTGGLPPNVVYMKLSTPIGVAVIDPGAASQDPMTQAIMQRLGMSVTLGFGPAPAPSPSEASLASNLSIGVQLVIGALALWLRPKLSTAIVVGAGALLLNTNLLSNFMASMQQPSAA